jgi:hypothetical protein
MKLRQPISLTEFCRRVRIRWHVGRRLCLKGAVRARRSRAGWLVDAADIPALLKSPPWERPDHRGPSPARVFAVNERLNAIRRRIARRP